MSRSLPSVRRALERLERKAALRLSHRSGIGTLLPGPARLRTRSACWLPRRQRACPSAALDERVHAQSSTGVSRRSRGCSLRCRCMDLAREACDPAHGLGVPPGTRRGGDDRRHRRRDPRQLVGRARTARRRDRRGRRRLDRRHRRGRPRPPARGWSPKPTILPEAGAGSGKGNALWKSLYECRGDLICWLDADLRNFRADYVTACRAAARATRRRAS